MDNQTAEKILLLVSAIFCMMLLITWNWWEIFFLKRRIKNLEEKTNN